ncbi:hypothetical protein BDB01DRAFT_790980 [Pilobolus umbonatus]|nr:hypothetical protein BDB01DRAFT_790980 [Pilobolus umbonatus]
MGLLEEFKARNFSLYAQWLGLLSILLLAILGGVTLATNTVFAIVGWVFAFMLVFVEVPFCTKFCPTSPKFDKFVSVFENSYYRGILYLM